jgi:hypothetical protein
MKLASVWVVAVGAVVWLGCSKDPGQSAQRAAYGKERGDCIAPRTEPGQPKDELAIGTCDPGLLCLSNVCVRPPPADCTAIGELLTSFDLGNYAEPEERAPIVEKYKRACQKAYVSKEQGECIAATTDKFAAIKCAPLMFPELKPAAGKATGDCDQVMAKLEGFLRTSMDTQQNPQLQSMLTSILVALRDSCDQDGWPAEFKKCILESGDNADAMSACNGQMPPEIQQKVTKRMSDAMQQQPQPPTTPF